MTMDRLIRLARLWNWLPAFRACAETQNLHRAAELLHVSPSALSRAVHLLEEDLGRPLFTRTGRNVQLNVAGDELLATLREAMRHIDDCITEVHTTPFSRVLHVSGFGEVTRFVVVPALCAIREKHPGLMIHVHSCVPVDVPHLLLSGQLDVAVVRRPEPTPHLLTETIGELRSGVYCGRGHPLFGAKYVEVSEILGHPFVAPVDDDGDDASAGFSDGWPAGLLRRVGMRSADSAVAVEVCARGMLLAALRCVTAEASRGGELQQLPVDIVPPTPLFALRRGPLGINSDIASDALVAALRVQVARFRSGPG